MEKISSLYTAWQQSRRQKQHRLAQGRLTANEAATKLPERGEIPLARLPVSHSAAPTIYAAAENGGHLFIVASPGSPWREQLILTLAGWPGAALVVDPDGQLYRQTGTLRQGLWGAVYALPGYRLRVNDLLRLWQPEIAFQLHQFLMPSNGRPGKAADDAQLNCTVSLFCAVGLYSSARKLNPFQLLLDLALTDMLTALAALETVPQARLYVRHFSKGQPPHLAIYDEATVQAFSWFSHQLWRYQEAYNTFATPEIKGAVVPEKWTGQKGSVYLTYTASQLAEIDGLAAAIVNSQLAEHQTYGGGQPMLLVLDAALAGRLPHFAQLLATAADYGITIILITPSLAALATKAPAGSGATLAGQFAHQLWYPPRDRETAAHMAWRYGTCLYEDGETVPVVSAEEMMAWPEDHVLLVTQRERPYCVLGQPVKLPEDFPQRQPPVPPPTAAMPRIYGRWLPELPDLTQQVAEVLVAAGAVPTVPMVADGKDDSEKPAVVGEPPKLDEPDGEKTSSDPTAAQERAGGQLEPQETAEEESKKSLSVARSRLR